MSSSGPLAALLRPRFLVPLSVATLAGASAGWLLPARYRAAALVKVEGDPAPGGSLEDEIFARPHLQALSTELAPYPEAAGAVERLRRDLAVRVSSLQTLSLEYEHADPRVAADVVNALSVRLAAGSGSSPAEAGDPIDERLTEARRELESKEGEQRRFLESRPALAESSAAAKTELERLRGQRQALEVERQRQAQQDANPPPMAPPAAPADPESAERERVRAELARLLERYTDQHPDVRKLRLQLAELERRAAPPPARATPLPRPDASEKLRLQAGVLDERIREAEARLQRGARTAQQVDTLAAEVEAAKQRYLDLLNQRVSERMASPGDQFRRSTLVFRVLEPAKPPVRPFSPDRRGLLLGGAALGLLMGLVLSFTARGDEPAALQRPAPPPRAAPPPARRTVSPGVGLERDPAHRPDVPLARAEPKKETRPARTSSSAYPALLEPGSIFWRTPRPARSGRAAEEAPPPAEPTPPIRPRGPDAGPDDEGLVPGTIFWQEARDALTETQPVPGARPSPLLGTDAVEPEPPKPPAREPPPPAPAPPPPVEEPEDPPPPETEPPAPEIEPTRTAPPAGTPATPPPEAPASGPRLVVFGGPLDGTSLALPPSASDRLIGAAAHAHFRVDLPNVDPVHARVASDSFGLILIDAGSARGTFVNRRRIASRYALKDGDVVSLGPPDSAQSLSLIVRLPHPPALAPVQSPGPASAVTPSVERAGPADRPRRRRERRGAILAALLTALAGAIAAWSGLLRSAPALAEVSPSRARPGQTLMLSGSGFEAVAHRNAVRVGSDLARVVSASASRLEVALPDQLGVRLPAALPVAVEVAGRRSNPLTLDVAAVPRIARLQPGVARSGETVTAALEPASARAESVHVAGVAAEVVGSEPGLVRFRVPAVAEASRVPVDLWVAGEPAERAYLAVGRLPLVAEVLPPRGPVGEPVALRGLGFDPDPTGNRVRFGESEALVVSAGAEELVVSAPPAASELVGHAELPISVEALGAVSTSPAHFTLLRPPSGTFLPRFFAAPVPELPGPNHAFVSTELGPLMLLTGPAGEASTARRAARVARVLNELVVAAAKPLVLAFAVEPAPGVALAGGSHVVATATAADVTGYEGLWARMGRSGHATPHSVATFWTALLQDQLSLFVQHQRPTHVLELSARGQVLADLYAQSRASGGDGRPGVPTELVSRLRTPLAGALREMALLVPQPGESNPGASVVGRWLGSLEEGDRGAQPIQVRLFFEGRRLAGALTRRARGVSGEVRLRNLAYEGGTLRFSLPAGSGSLAFRGTVREGSLAGLISGAEGREVGFFTLRLTE